MCPRDLDNVLVAGRTMSSDRITNGTLRIMPCCLNAGEAVGIAAKLAADMEAVNIHQIRKLLFGNIAPVKIFYQIGKF